MSLQENISEELQKIEVVKDRVELIDDLIHFLNFERRITLLTKEQWEHMNSNGLSPECIKRLDGCKTDVERDDLFKMYARSLYFRQCAWVNYLNGGSNKPPVGEHNEL